MSNQEQYISLSEAADYTSSLDNGVEADDMWHMDELLARESPQLASDIQTVRNMVGRYNPTDTIYGESMAAEKAQSLLDALHEYRDEVTAAANHVLQKRLGLFVVHASDDYEVVSEVRLNHFGLWPTNANLRSSPWYVDKAFMTDDELSVVRRGRL